eukprot:TRINITY_DN28028_c0_g1_i2.p1 TRINITY_DN28028_c0_g1~~TRINITY_DN28028_c0_g1_i2.p1  ORF type:complete len:712 (+),score=65.79 TRINITY_DN28028_c0_g1_i2:99-2234(+)
MPVPHWVGVLLLLCTLETARGMDAKAREQYSKHMERGGELFTAGSMLAAADEYRQAAAIMPSMPAQFNLAASLHSTEDPSLWHQALENYKLVASVQPQHDKVYLQMGALLRSMSRAEDATVAYTRAVAITPTSSAYEGLGCALVESGRLEEAYVEFERSLSGSEAQSVAYNNIGVVLREMRNDQAAEENFRRALQVEKDLKRMATTYVNLGISAAKYDRDKAIEAFETAITLDPQHPGAYSNLANMVIDEPVRAVELNRISLALAPNCPQTLYNAGAVLGEACRFREQMAHFKAAQRMWLRDFENYCPGATVDSHWYQGAQVKFLPEALQAVAVGASYGISGWAAQSSGLVPPGARQGAFNNLVLHEKKLYGITLSNVQLQGIDAVLRQGCRVLLTTPRLYVPLQTERLPLVPASSRKIVELQEAISVVSFSGHNYFHFLCEVLPRVVVSRVLWPERFKKVPLLIRDVRPGVRNHKISHTPLFVNETLTALGISVYLKYDRHAVYRAKTLHVVDWWPTDTRPDTSFHAPASALRLARSELRQAFAVAKKVQAAPLVVWVSRRGRDRDVLNEDAVLTALREQLSGVEILRWAGNEGMAAAAVVFGRADVVVGPHGAGLSNILFCEKCELVELALESAQMRYFAHLAMALEIRYQALMELPHFRQTATVNVVNVVVAVSQAIRCLLYTSDAADEEDSVDLGGRRIIKKKTKNR